MFRGTTPKITFKSNVDLQNAEKVLVTFSQGNKELFTLGKSDFEITETELTCELTQLQTLAFDSSKMVEMQIRALVDGSAIASNIMKAEVNRILKGGVL